MLYPMHEGPSIRRSRCARQGAGTTAAGAQRRRSDGVAAASFTDGTQSVTTAAQRLPIRQAMPIRFASSWPYGVAGSRGARRWRGRVRYRERSVPSRLLKACRRVSAFVFAARRRRGLTAGANACGAVPRRLVELHRCSVRCWALSNSGAARSKRSASDCWRWQRYAVESCGPQHSLPSSLLLAKREKPAVLSCSRERKSAQLAS